MFAQTSRREGRSQKCTNYRKNEGLNNIYEQPAQHNEHYARSDRNSYRPIALTSHTATLMEKVIDWFITVKITVIPSNQAGFR